ncbi:MAG: hypothetical protein WBM17_15530 [Anaerolineales bacterium]
MDLRANHSFIIRIMVDPVAEPGNTMEWKGMIQSVTSGERRYFRDIEEIPVLIRRILGLTPEASQEDSPSGE